MAIDATVATEATQPLAGLSKAAKPQIKLTVSGIIMDLENGLDRTAIATKYDLSTSEVNEIFKHPKLKGLRPKRKTTRITLIDDTDDSGNISSALMSSDMEPGDNELSLMAKSEESSDMPNLTVSPDTFSEFNN